MIQKLVVLVFVVSFALSGKSQEYGNEWINYGQVYYKFPVLSTGLHKLDYQQMQNANLPLSSISSANLQIFGRQREVPLYVVDGGDNSMDDGDYVLFYADKNDGWLDSTLYTNPQGIGNPGYSLYNDTIYYFLSWNNSTSNARFQTSTDVDFPSYLPANYIRWTQLIEYHQEYFEGKTIASLTSSFYNNGEGYVRSKGVGPFNQDNGFNTSYRYTGFDAPLAHFQGKSYSRNNPLITNPNDSNHHTRWKLVHNDSLLYDIIYRDIKTIDFRTDFRAGSLVDGTTQVRFSNVGDLPPGNDLQGMSFARLEFPKTPNLSGFTQGKFKMDNANAQTKIHLQLTGVNFSAPLFFSLGAIPLHLKAVSTGANSYQMLIPNNTAGLDQEIIYCSENNTLSVSNLTLVNGTGTFTDFTQLVLDSALLFVYHPILANGVQDYEQYRSSITGGGYQVIKGAIDELYLQFGGGIPKHINGIRRWSKLMYDQSVRKPSGLFLIGKGIREAPYDSYPFQSLGTRGNASYAAQSLIPSFGQPSSDMAITASWQPNNWMPFIPTGRISVNNNLQLLTYLDKVKEFDAQQNPLSVYDFENKDWQKQVLHFGGGTDQLQQATFQSYLDEMEGIIEDSLFAGNVHKLYKKTSDPFDPSEFNEITERLSSGVSIINFFGHANPATNGFEINIEEPSNWNNQGKYPLVIANTCLNGNIFHRETTNEFSTSEKFVRTENAGAIAFISTVFLGFSSTLSNYTKGLYTQMSKEAYGQTIGNQIKHNLVALQADFGYDYLLESNALQMSLNGDPMLRINWHEKPEIDVSENRLTFLPEKIDLTTDSITLLLDIRNLGKAITDTFNVEIRRKFPISNVDSLYTVQVPRLNYNYLLSYKIPLQPNIGIGVNTISATLDLPSKYAEMYDEITNNQISKTLFINIDGIVPLLPHNFAVIPSDSVVLKASTIDPLAALKTYRFEVDTTDLFNSPFLRHQEISSLGGVIEALPSDWKLSSTNTIQQLQCEDSAVYFWRVALVQQNLNWKESSFQYIKGKRGWGQDHFFQFKENDYSQIQYLRNSREKLFDPTDTSFLECHSYPSSYGTVLNNWLINGEQQDYELCQNIPQIQVGVVDPVNMKAWGTRYGGFNPSHFFGNYNDNGSCRPRVEYYFLFRQDNASQLAAFQNMVLNEVPDGHYMVIYFPKFGPRYDLWNSIDSAGMYGTMSLLGFDSIKTDNPLNMAALFVKKGFPNTAVQEIAANSGDPVHLRAGMVGVASTGQETSTLIGPAANWETFYWKLDPYQGLGSDTTYLEIESFNSQQQYQGKIQYPVTQSDSIINFNNLIDAQSSPYVRLRAIYSDTVNLTPAQLDYWHLLYEELPEAAIDGKNGYLWTGNVVDTIEEGKDIQFAIDVRNISDYAMDSLLISYWVEDQNHIRQYLNYSRQDSLRVGEVFRDTIQISTLGLTGDNIFWMEVNPYNQSGLDTDQPELAHFNNLLQIPFSIRGDRINPLLDVTFDGRHILNGDIVNPTPEIVITLKDENLLQLMSDVSDTNNFGIYLTGPDGVSKRVPFVRNGEINMQWIPADAQSKKFKIIYPAEFLADGKYTLSVQGIDRSGNLSGDMDYRVTFEIIRESSITYMMNYPNPFSTSTRFVFTLTGSTIPDELIIQIMTINGRVVREITEDEFGPIYIGRNISEYAWDGTDEFGDRLANGVYLYRVKMKISGEDIKHRDSGADSHFTKEFGKMYLMR